jgi:hypothetical protein
VPDELPLAVFLPEGGEGYVLRYEIARLRVARDGRVYTRRTVRPDAPNAPKWHLYTEHPIGPYTMDRALELLRDFLAREAQLR